MPWTTAKAVLITAPAADVLTLAEVKQHLRVDHSDEDDVITRCRDAAINQLDPAAGGWLGRALRLQTWELRLDGFPCHEIPLPYPPFSEIVSFKYDDTGGIERALAVTTGYRILGFTAGDQPPRQPVRLAPPYMTYWPATRSDVQTVRIQWKCGYVAAATDPLSSDIKNWLLMAAATFYANRETMVVGAPVFKLPDHVINSIFNHRVP